MFILQLNPMTANAERVIPVACAGTREALEQLIESERVEPYTNDNGFRINFSSNGPLYNFNPPGPDGSAWIDVPAIVDIGTVDDWMQQAADQFNSLVNSVPNAESLL